MSMIKTANGKFVDMTALAERNADMPAISPGAERRNARGDAIDAKGNVIATVQDMSRMQQRHQEPEEKVSVSEAAPSDAPKRKESKLEKKAPAKKSGKPKIVSEIERTRDDGTRYMEIEYDDGSIETKEVEE